MVPTVLALLDLPAEVMPLVDRARSLLPLLDRSQNEERLHFAELSRGGSDFTLARPSPQTLYQCCVRDSHHKVLFHAEPLLMTRYKSCPVQAQRLLRRARQRLLRKQSNIEVDLAHGYWCWHDLKSDSAERRPQPGHSAPLRARALRLDLERLYSYPLRGPAIGLDDFEESHIFQRLRALGYVE
jgi:hypothetical protein